MESKNHFSHRLESLRGVAALAVAIHHTFAIIQTHGLQEKIVTAIQGVFYGRGAVFCFFILSGLVLGQSLRRMTESKTADYINFCLRRILRIYPVFIITLLICLAMLRYNFFFKSEGPAVSEFYAKAYTSEATWGNFFRNALFIDTNLNDVTWTLAIEMGASLILPVLHFASRSDFLRVGMFIGLLLLYLFKPHSQTLLGATPEYLWMFYLGYLIPLVPSFIPAYLLSRFHVLVGLLVAAMLICVLTHHFGHHVISYVVAVGFIIAVIFHLPKSKLLSVFDSGLLKFLGRISYSFYLLHMPILFALASLMYLRIPVGYLLKYPLAYSSALLLISLGITVPLSVLSYKFIEKPTISLGKILRGRNVK